MVDELLDLFLEPFLVVLTNAVFVGSSSAMGFPNGWRVVGQEFVTVITIIPKFENIT